MHGDFVPEALFFKARRTGFFRESAEKSDFFKKNLDF